MANFLDDYQKDVDGWNKARVAEVRANCERIWRAATRPGDPDQLDLFLDFLKDQDRLDEVPRSPSFQREWRIV